MEQKKNAAKPAGDTNSKWAGDADKNKAKGVGAAAVAGADAGRSKPQGGNGTEAGDVSKQQGTHKETPQRDHERERSMNTPGKASTGKNSAEKDRKNTNEDDVDERPPGSHGTSSNIDDTQKAR